MSTETLPVVLVDMGMGDIAKEQKDYEPQGP